MLYILCADLHVVMHMIWKKVLFSKCTENIADMEYLYICSFEFNTVIASDINFYIHVYMQKKIIYEFEFDL